MIEEMSDFFTVENNNLEIAIKLIWGEFRMKKRLFLTFILILLCFLLLNPSQGALKKKSPPVPDNISVETPEQYVDRMIEDIRYYMDGGYYTESLYFLSDLKAANEKGLGLETIIELEKELNRLYSPEKENSCYNTDVLRCVKDFTGKYGYIDQNGIFVIPAKFDQAYEFSQGLALVIQDDERFFINRKGETEIYFKPEEKIDIRGSFKSGLALCYYDGQDVEKGNGFAYIDQQGEIRFFLPGGNKYKMSYEPYSFSEGYAVVRDRNKNLYGYIDTDGKWLVEPIFKHAYAFQNEMAAVVYPNTDLYVYIDTTGQPAFRLPIREAWNYCDEVTMVKTKESLVYIDKSGQEFYDPTKEKLGKLPCAVRMSQRFNGLMGIRLREGNDHKNKQGIIFVNKQNQRSLAFIEQIDVYISNDEQEFIPFSNGRAFVYSMYHGWGMINLRGDFVVKPQKQWVPVTCFYNGLAQIHYRNEKSDLIDVRYINREGKIVFVE